MTRGRKKDLTIPPTRALVQQRDYRARRAQYVADLEERIHKAEEENHQLRSELAAARASQNAPSPTYDVQTAHASSELLQSLSLASASLARFHRLAFPAQHLDTQDSRQLPLLEPPHSSEVANMLRPASFPSPAPSPPYPYPTPDASTSHSYYPNRRKRLYGGDSPEPVNHHSEDVGCSRRECRSESPESECCGGIIDCTGLIEPDDFGDESNSPTPPQMPPAHADQNDSQTLQHGFRRY